MADTAKPISEPPPFWRSLEERSGSEQVLVSLEYEFPRGASVWDDTEQNRRQFLQLMGGSIALAGAAGCNSDSPEHIMPYVHAPEAMVAGIPLHFATAMPTPDGALGLIVKSNMGRPTKIEGNPLHPASLGATDAQAQASILDLYDPDRSQTVVHLGEISTWPDFVDAVRSTIEELRGRNGAGLHLLTEPIASPTLARQLRELLDALPDARWHEYAPLGRENARGGALWAFGQEVQPIYSLSEADMIVSLDSGFLTTGAGAVRYARDFASRRPPQADGSEPNRLYAIESSFTPTGAASDHRLAVKPSAVAELARGLCSRLGVELPNTSDHVESHSQWLDAAAEDLRAHGNRSLVIAGEQQSAAVHAMAHALNAALGSVGTTVRYVAPMDANIADRRETLAPLVEALHDGSVELLLILNGNPVYNAPANLNFLAGLKKAKQAVHVSQYNDETSEWCQWHVPVAHYLESWGDCRAYDGTAAIVQPLIAPLYGSKTDHEVLSALFDASPQQGYDLVRATWQQERPQGFEPFWEQAVREGAIADSQAEAVNPPIEWDSGNAPEDGIADTSGAELEIAFRGDPSIGDGRYANNGWLQEVPKPLTKLTWSNAVILAPATADELGVKTEDVVRLEYGGRSTQGAVLVQPGHPPGTVTVHFGYGRKRAGRIGTDLGFDAYSIWTGSSAGGGVKLIPTGETMLLARTQHHHLIDGRNIVYSATAAENRKNPAAGLPHAAHHGEASLLPEWDYDGFAWGMSVDLTKCIGCNACVVACQAENNIPIVGAEGVARGREMHWLRIDSYYLGEPDEMRVVQQPMMCQHCEKAPCEPVCPVAATTHSEEGLNEMTYNRCVGTRYCSNNCPYKVRRFNFFEYNAQAETTPVLKLLHNPDVTVRSRGVMEKCTYCVQRINAARIDAKKQAIGTGEQPRIADGTLQTACQAACPSQAIVFGDINDPNSRVTQLKKEPRNYGVLSELGTQPRTTYLVQLRNPNPALEENR